MWRSRLVLAFACFAGGCGSSNSGPQPGLATGDTPTAPAINGGAASGPAISGGTASGPSAGAGGGASGPSVNGGAGSMPTVGSASNSGGGSSPTMSCAQVAAYAGSQGVPPQCTACLQSSCCDALLGCYNNQECLAYVQCLGSCNNNPAPNSPPDCGCDSQYPSGQSAYNSYSTCAIGPCSSACVTITMTNNNVPGGSSGGASCQSTGSACSQNSDCCSNNCGTITSSGATLSLCE